MEKATRYKHGFRRSSEKRTKEYMAWDHMIRRCTCPSNKIYHRYGGRGIKVCKKWLKSYPAFLKDMGEAPSPQHSLDRIRNSGHYTPSNCRWATYKEQNRNRRDNVRLRFNGQLKTVAEWAEVLGMPRRIIYERRKRGWPTKLALTVPPKTKLAA